VTDSVSVWDLRLDTRAGPSAVLHTGAETLCVDWSCFNSSVLATASADHALRVWDIRNAAKGPTSAHVGHTLALLGVAFSPWSPCELLTTSYDQTVARWDVSPLMSSALVRKWTHHSEFAQAAAWSPIVPDLAASVGWDRQLRILG
jgi:peroxin-7